MAARTRREAASKPAIVIDEADPQSWLYLNPAGASNSGIVFGVLRSTYAGRTNRALEFGWHKAHPIKPDSGFDLEVWRPTAERVEVLLPDGAEDALADPAVLLERMDVYALGWQKALLVYATLPLGDVGRIHEGWERARAFVREHLVRDRKLAAILCLHSPGRAGSDRPLHAHVLVVPRTADGLGLAHGCYDEALIHDTGQSIIEAAWTDHLETFR